MPLVRICKPTTEKLFHHRGTERADARNPIPSDHARSNLSWALEAKPPEAARTVAGGASASERPPVYVWCPNFDPGRGRGAFRYAVETPRPLPGSRLELHLDTG